MSSVLCLLQVSVSAWFSLQLSHVQYPATTTSRAADNIRYVSFIIMAGKAKRYVGLLQSQMEMATTVWFLARPEHFTAVSSQTGSYPLDNSLPFTRVFWNRLRASEHWQETLHQRVYCSTERTHLFLVFEKNDVRGRMVIDVQTWTSTTVSRVWLFSYGRVSTRLYIHNRRSFSSKIYTRFNKMIYKVVQIWPGLFVCKQVTVCPGHIWTTL